MYEFWCRWKRKQSYKSNKRFKTKMTSLLRLSFHLLISTNTEEGATKQQALVMFSVHLSFFVEKKNRVWAWTRALKSVRTSEVAGRRTSERGSSVMEYLVSGPSVLCQKSLRLQVKHAFTSVEKSLPPPTALKLSVVYFFMGFCEIGHNSSWQLHLWVTKFCEKSLLGLKLS